MAKFKPGESGNPDGRPKGTPNRTTAQIKNLLNEFVSQNLDDIQEQYNKLDASEKLQFFEKVLRYVLPRQSSMAVDARLEDNREMDLSSMSTEELIQRAKAVSEIEKLHEERPDLAGMTTEELEELANKKKDD